jgi:flagellar motor protein MotB
VIDSGKCGDAGVERHVGQNLSQRSRSAALAAAVGIGLALGGCSTMSDIGEATSEGVSSAANAMNPFNWFGGKDEEQAKKDEEAGQRAKQERAVASTATKTGIKSAARDDLAQRAATEADESRYPKLATVPDRPKDAASKKADQGRTALREGLVADTANAQYTDKELRAPTTPAAPQGQPDLARSDARVAGEPPARPAPTTPVAAEPAPPLPAAASAPRVAPPQVARAEEPSRNYGARQAAAASAAPVTPVAPPTPAAPPAAAPTRQASLVQPPPERPRAVLKTVQVATIYFNDGSARLSANDRRLVDQVAEAARRTGGTIRIIGHSSMGASSGDAERVAMVNYKVSLDRANAVAVELLRSGVPDSRLQVIAEGSRNPIYAESARTGAAGNRRAEVYLDYYEQL